jgi:hypothetical protein
MEDTENSFGKLFEEFNKEIEAAQEAAKLTPGIVANFNLDIITDKYINDLCEHTKRPLLIYAVDFFNGQKAAISNNEISIIPSDKDGIVETTRKLPHGPLDIILHSPGGSLEATESIVDILRSKFSDIRFFIPNTAKSAATMLALSGDEVYLASSAELGPIDPQMILRKDGGINQSAAQAIIDQFEAAQEDLSSNPSKLPAWIPILPMYGPSLYQDSKNAIKLAKEVVRSWLIEYMFKTLPNKKARLNRARRVVNFFADHKRWKSHARKIGLVEIDQNLKGLLSVKKLDDDPILYNKVMGVYYCIIQTFQRSFSFKIIRNNIGNRYIRQIPPPPVQQLLKLPQITIPQPHP